MTSRIYKITLDEDLKPGEWGFFMGTARAWPCPANANTVGGTSQGRMYDFAIPK